MNNDGSQSHPGAAPSLAGRLATLAASAELPPSLSRELAHLSGALEQLREEHEDLALMHEALLEHATALENELSDKNEQISLMVDKMRRYLSSQLYQRIVGGAIDADTRVHSRRLLTVFFSDIVGFTDITDTLEPEALSSLLNAYLNAMASICDRYGGTLDKFIGDAIMVFFGDDGSDPAQAAERCVRMAIEMQAEMLALQSRPQFQELPQLLQIRVGINTGYCTIGNFGSNERMDYTLIGGSVNVASRLESQCPPGGILISGATYRLVKDVVEAQPLGPVKVKGVARAVDTYAVSGLVPAPSEDDAPVLIAMREDGFDLPPISFARPTCSELQRTLLVRSLRRALNALEGQPTASGDGAE